MTIYKHEDILIIGDSFVGMRYDDNHWPFILHKRLTGQAVVPRGRGYGGGAWWSTRNNFLYELELGIPKLLIINHTEPNRLPDDNGYGINSNSGLLKTISTNIEPNSNEKDIYSSELKYLKAMAAHQYYQYLHSYSFFRYATLAWYKELDDIIKEKDIKQVVHMFMRENFENYVFQTGCTISEKLLDYAIEGNYKDSPNHFSFEGNIIFANCLYNFITNYDVGLQTLNLEQAGMHVADGSH